jgi:transcriptional regulator with XRE-family HTH domain
MSKANNNLGHFLRMRSMTAKELADRSGISKTTISRLISGEREANDVARRLAAALGYPVADVFPLVLEHDSTTEASGD